MKKNLKATDRRRGNLTGRGGSDIKESESGEGKRLVNFNDRRAVKRGRRTF